jgi:predicted nucleic acid-binding protein
VTVLLDTDVLVDHLRGDAAATALFRDATAAGRRVAASVLTRIELHRASGASPQALDSLDVFVDWVPVDHAIAAMAVEHAERHGEDAVRCVIAATARRLGADLLTRDHY